MINEFNVNEVLQSEWFWWLFFIAGMATLLLVFGGGFGRRRP